MGGGGSGGGGGVGGGTDTRLNLLLSWGGWRPDSWADNIECLLRPLGVESMRARTARQAEQVIRSRTVHIAVVDLGLPLDAADPHQAARHHEEAGARILDLLRRLGQTPPTIIVKSTRASRDNARDLAAALRFDAFAVVDRTSADVELMLKVLQRCLERFYHGRWPDAHPHHRAHGLHPLHPFHHQPRSAGGGFSGPPGGRLARWLGLDAL